MASRQGGTHIPPEAEPSGMALTPQTPHSLVLLTTGSVTGVDRLP